jgi:uncharacterized SAM-binding protein YcdF (DUF218 family)
MISVGVIVLGYHSERDRNIHPIQRWRVDIARRSAPTSAEGLTVFSGGARVGIRSEAEAMAGYTESLDESPRLIKTEVRSRSTWENVAFSLPLVEHCDVIVVASDPMHSARARRYARQQRPDLGERIASSADYRLLERWWLKVPTAAYELQTVGRSLFRDSRG